MKPEQMESLFERNGYSRIPSNLPEFTLYYRRENQGAVVIQLIDDRQGIDLSGEQYAHLKHKIIEFMHARGEQEVHLLSLVLSCDTEKVKRLCAGDSFCWMIDADNNRLIVYENQAADFYGWRGILEEFLLTEGACTYDRHGSDAVRKISVRELPWATACLVAVNVILFLICTITGDLLYNIGMLDFPMFVEEGAYYQIVTSMFLHADAMHLFNNMIMLYFLGKIVEQKLGHLSYTALYFLSGIAGNMLSIGCAMLLQETHRSLGASGAVFGVEGAFLLLVIVGRCREESMPVRRIFFAILFSLYCGFTSPGVDNAAHVGGILMGFALAGVFCMLYPRKSPAADSAGRERKDGNVNEG